MTIEELIGKSIEDLEKMTDAEKESYFSQFFDVTRPAEAKRVAKSAGCSKGLADKMANLSPDQMELLKTLLKK